MASKKKPQTEGPLLSEDIEQLCELARRFPFRWWGREVVMKMCDLGEDTMSMLVRVGAPVAGKKLNPFVLTKWIEENADKIGKVGGE